MKKTFAGFTLALVTVFGATFSQAGIIVGDGKTDVCKDGIIISDAPGIIVGDAPGIIVGDLPGIIISDVVDTIGGIIVGDQKCTAKDGIIVGDAPTGGIIVGD